MKIHSYSVLILNSINMKFFVIAFILLVSFTACSTVKQIHREKSETKSEISTSENMTTESQIVTTIKITEKKDSILVFSGSELSVSAKFQDLLGGDTIYATGEELSLKTFYDSLSKTIKTQAIVNPRTIHINIDKTTEINQVATGSVTTNKQTQQKQTIQTETRDKRVQRNSFPTWVILLVIILVIGLIVFLILKFRRYL